MSDSDSDMPRLPAAGSRPRPLRRLKKAGAARPSTDAPPGGAGRAPGTAPVPQHGLDAVADPDAERGALSPAPAPAVAPSGVSDGALQPTAGAARPMRASPAPPPPASHRRPRAKSVDDGYWDEEDELAEDLARGRSASPTEGEGEEEEEEEEGAADPASAPTAAAGGPPPAAEGDADGDDDDDAPSGSYSEYTDTESGSMQLDDLHAETARLLRGAFLFFCLFFRLKERGRPFSPSHPLTRASLSLFFLHRNRPHRPPGQGRPRPGRPAHGRPARPP